MDAVSALNNGTQSVSDVDQSLATIATTYRTTAILEAGRLSLDGHCAVQILYGEEAHPCRPTKVRALDTKAESKGSVDM